MFTNLKKIPLLLIIILSILSLTPINAAEIPSSMEYQGAKLTLNGHGTRVKFFMKVYDTSLYLVSASNNAEEILDSDEAMAIRLDVTSSMVTTDAMKDALNSGLVKSTGGNTDSISEEIKQLTATFTSDVSDSDFLNLFIFQIQEPMYLKILHISTQFLELNSKKLSLGSGYLKTQYRKI